MRPTFDDPEFRQAVLAVVNAAGRDAHRHGYDKGTRNRCQEVFHLARTVSKVIPARDLRAKPPGHDGGIDELHLQWHLLEFKDPEEDGAD